MTICLCQNRLARAVVVLVAGMGIGAGQEAGPGSKKEVEFNLGGDEVLKLVHIEPGRFTMGAPRSELDPLVARGGKQASILYLQEEAHEVELTKHYYLGKFEVTRGQFRQFVKQEQYLTEWELADLHWFSTEAPPVSWKSPGFQQEDHHPVVCVTWNDALAFCRWLSHKTGKSFDLPTEAEWEYACRAGKETAYTTGDNIDSIKGYGNFADEAALAHWKKKGQPFPHDDVVKWSDGHVFTAPVGSFRPNAFGLYDMHGNVAEWSKDRYNSDLAIDAPRTDPQSSKKGKHRVIRGGGYLSRMMFCRSAARQYNAAGIMRNDLGFRVVMRP